MSEMDFIKLDVVKSYCELRMKECEEIIKSEKAPSSEAYRFGAEATAYNNVINFIKLITTGKER